MNLNFKLINFLSLMLLLILVLLNETTSTTTKKKNIVDFNDADVERLYEEWEV